MKKKTKVVKLKNKKPEADIEAFLREAFDTLNSLGERYHVPTEAAIKTIFHITAIEILRAEGIRVLRSEVDDAIDCVTLDFHPGDEE